MDVRRSGALRQVTRSRRAPDLGDDGGFARRGASYVLVRVAVYLATLGPILWVYSTKGRALLISPPIGAIAAVGTWLLLQRSTLSQPWRVGYAVGVALCVVELTWALGYWTLSPLVGGATIWLAFYVLSGIAEHRAFESLDRRVTLEYAGVAALGALIVIATAFFHV